jgi:hypothetical protein
MINSWDIDGVLFLGNKFRGLTPESGDVIITGRSFQETVETLEFLRGRGINNHVHFNSKKLDDKTRKSSGEHKARTLNKLKNEGMEIGIHFEDDPIQAAEIRKDCPWVEVVLIVSDLVEKENTRHR